MTLLDELPSIADAPVKNAQSGIAYIGVERCAACHREAETTYRHTAHARALAEIDIAAEPPDGEFFDSRSQRHYRTYRQDGLLRHEESLRTTAGEPLVLCDLPVRYVIGSGHFSRSYLVEREGYLFQSPVTWYATPKEWNLSPGYDQANQGFQRAVGLRCLVCHAGRLEPIERSPQRVALPALAVDCERCHGPGELHARKWDGVIAGRGVNTERDETIFNPASYDRQIGEDVCAQCHLHSAATAPSEKTAAHREKCLKCHTDQSCRAPAESRSAPTVQDNCIQCHMPRGPTEIPHFAFTHHRIGIHKTAPDSVKTDLDELMAIPGSPTLPPLDDLRNLGLAYLQFAGAPGQESRAAAQAAKAEWLLQQVQRAGLNDSEVDAALARIKWRADAQEALRHAHAVVAAKDASPEAWATACFTLGSTYYSLNQPTEARPWLEQTVSVRPTADAYIMLSDCLAVAGDATGAVAAARRGCELAPDQPRFCTTLIAYLKAAGAVDEAEALRPRFEELSKHHRRVDPRR